MLAFGRFCRCSLSIREPAEKCLGIDLYPHLIYDFAVLVPGAIFLIALALLLAVIALDPQFVVALGIWNVFSGIGLFIVFITCAGSPFELHAFDVFSTLALLVSNILGSFVLGSLRRFLLVFTFVSRVTNFVVLLPFRFFSVSTSGLFAFLTISVSIAALNGSLSFRLLPLFCFSAVFLGLFMFVMPFLSMSMPMPMALLRTRL